MELPKAFYLDRWQRMNIPIRSQGLRFADYVPVHRSGQQALEGAQQFVEEYFDHYVSPARAKAGKVPSNRFGIGKGQMYYGRNGTRKSTLAITVLTELQYKYGLDFEGYYIRFSEWQRALQDTYGKEDTERIAIARQILCRVESCHTVVLDDVGQEYRTATEWTQSKFGELIRVRFEAGRPTIITSNIDPEGLGGVYGDSVGSFRWDAFDTYPLLGRDTRVNKD